MNKNVSTVANRVECPGVIEGDLFSRRWARNDTEFIKKCRDLKMRSSNHSTHLVLFVDADNLKQVNDFLGHSAGDDLITLMFDILHTNCPAESVIFRAGGDEFMVYLNFEEPEHSEAIARKISSALNQIQEVGTQRMQMSCSVGAAQIVGESVDIPTMLERADAALLWTKRHRKGCLNFYDAIMCGEIHLERTLATNFPSALLNNELEIFYQPIFDTRNRHICGAEALIRWTHGRTGTVPAELIVSTAEKTGKTGALGEYVLMHSSRFALNWPSDMFLAVNFAASDFQRIDFAEKVLDIIFTTGFRPSLLHMEITETEFFELSDIAVSNLKMLQNAGVKVGVDDFGTGYSSMGSIDKFPADFVKVDRSLISDCDTRISSRIFLRAVLAISQVSGLNLVAEGVETLEELAVVRSTGINYAQGFYYSKALPEDSFLTLLNTKVSIIPAFS